MELPCGHDVGGLMHVRGICVVHRCTRPARGAYVVINDPGTGHRGIRIDYACNRHRFEIRRLLRKLPSRDSAVTWVWGKPRKLVMWTHQAGRCDDTKFTSVTPQH